MSGRQFTVGDVVRLSGTRRIAIVVAHVDKKGFIPVVEVLDDWEYDDPQNYQADRWDYDALELLIPAEKADDFPQYGKGGEV